MIIQIPLGIVSVTSGTDRYRENGLSLPLTVVEQKMMSASQALRLKPAWDEKILNSEIRGKWKQEMIDQGMKEGAAEYVLKEMELYYRKIKHDNTLGIEVSAIDGAYQSDTLIPESIRELLLQAVKPLEDVPEEEKDWHPDSGSLVLDLVHPSLFCLVNHTSPALSQDRIKSYLNQFHPSLAHRLVTPTSTSTSSTPDDIKLPSNHLDLISTSLSYMGDGSIEPIKVDYKQILSDTQADPYAISQKYQWLPCEMYVDHVGKVSILSYINNAHPIQHQPIYHVVEQVMERFVPMFERVLADLNRGPVPRRVEPDPNGEYHEDIDEEEEEDDGEEHRPLKIPEPDEFTEASIPLTLPINLKNSHLQVIVKLANIVLTPEKPRYEGGSWHVEGMMNERIVASGIYYYESTNITESILSFRQTVDGNIPYEQSDDHGVTGTYGLRNEGECNQQLGGIITQTNRCIAFPNIYQHQVQPFELEDKTKPGIRKILVFFLVDPVHPIISTLHIPPQQHHWYEPHVVSTLTSATPLPIALIPLITSYLSDIPMSLDAAKQHRSGLMDERRKFVRQNNEVMFEREFSFCEH